jgi:hypothetical protein
MIIEKIEPVKVEEDAPKMFWLHTLGFIGDKS